MNQVPRPSKRGRPKGTNKPEAEKTRRVSMRFTPDVIDLVEQGTRLDGNLKALNKTEFVKNAIKFYYDSISRHGEKESSVPASDQNRNVRGQEMIPDFVDYIQQFWTSGDHKASASFPIYARILRAAQYIDLIEMKLRAEPYNLSLNEYRILVSLRRNEEKYLTPSSLRDELLVSPGTITRQVDHLVEMGLVDRRHDSKDRRRVEISLTRSGSMLIDSIFANTKTDFLGEFTQQLSIEEKYFLEMTLRKLLVIFYEYLKESNL